MSNRLNTTERTVIFEYKKYSITKNMKNGVWSMWYGDRILSISSERRDVMDRFKRIKENFEVISS